MNTIAQEWREFAEVTYGAPINREVEREYRMLFATGFNACLRCMAEIGSSGLSSDEMTARVAALSAEYRSFALDYIQDRLRE